MIKLAWRKYFARIYQLLWLYFGGTYIKYSMYVVQTADFWWLYLVGPTESVRDGAWELCLPRCGDMFSRDWVDEIWEIWEIWEQFLVVVLSLSDMSLIANISNLLIN